MPELPEVEPIRGDLEKALVGRRIAGFATTWPRAVERPDAAAIGRLIPGQTITRVDRRGKYLLLALSGGLWLVCHLRMTGRLLIRARSDPEDRHVHTRFALDGDGELRFSDARKFGRLWLVADPQEVVGSLGPEPFDPALDAALLAGRLAGRRGPIKPLLLDQRVLAGVGNIYADESLFAARLLPTRSAASLSGEEVQALLEGLRLKLALGLQHRGTTMGDYLDAHGNPGAMRHHLAVYRREEQPCLECATPIRRIKLAGRSSFFCPTCQR